MHIASREFYRLFKIEHVSLQPLLAMLRVDLLVAIFPCESRKLQGGEGTEAESAISGK
jgi:hypothetical protein